MSHEEPPLEATNELIDADEEMARSFEPSEFMASLTLLTGLILWAIAGVVLVLSIEHYFSHDRMLIDQMLVAIGFFVIGLIVLLLRDLVLSQLQIRQMLSRLLDDAEDSKEGNGNE